MAKIEVALVDEHFMHGQVALSWCNVWDSRLIIVVNDELAHNKTKQGLLEMTVPDEITTRFYAIEKAKIKLRDLCEDRHAVLITGSVEDLFNLIEAGISVPRIILSSIPFVPGQVRISSTVSLDPKQIEKMKLLEAKGVDVQTRQRPDEKAEALVF